MAIGLAIGLAVGWLAIGWLTTIRLLITVGWLIIANDWLCISRLSIAAGHRFTLYNSWAQVDALISLNLGIADL